MGNSSSYFQKIPQTEITYCYYDYIDTWFKFMLFQTPEQSQSWFINFDKKCNQTFSLWFQCWWNQIGSISKIFLTFSMIAPPKIDRHNIKFPYLFHLFKKYKIPWIFKWNYVKTGDILVCHYFIQMKSFHIYRDYPLLAPKSKARNSLLLSKLLFHLDI